MKLVLFLVKNKAEGGLLAFSNHNINYCVLESLNALNQCSDGKLVKAVKHCFLMKAVTEYHQILAFQIGDIQAVTVVSRDVLRVVI